MAENLKSMKINHELVLPNEGLHFKVFLFEGYEGNYHRENHWHQSIEIFAVCDGQLIFQMSDKRWTLNPGQFVIVNSNEIHGVLAPDPNKTIVLQIPLQTFENYFTGEHFIWFSHEPGQQDERVMELIREIYDIYTEKAYGYHFSATACFFQLMYLLVTEYRMTEVSQEFYKSSKKLNKLSEITSYMKTHHSSDMQLTDVAGTFGYSPTYLSRMFKKYAGVNFKNYLQSVRIEFALDELKNSRQSINAIALEHGFPNSKAFARAFFAKYGILPSDYRKKARN